MMNRMDWRCIKILILIVESMGVSCHSMCTNVSRSDQLLKKCSRLHSIVLAYYVFNDLFTVGLYRWRPSFSGCRCSRLEQSA